MALTKAALKSSLARGGCFCARAEQARSALDGLSLSSSMEKPRIQTTQSSLVLRCDAAHAFIRFCCDTCSFFAATPSADGWPGSNRPYGLEQG